MESVLYNVVKLSLISLTISAFFFGCVISLVFFFHLCCLIILLMIFSFFISKRKTVIDIKLQNELNNTFTSFLNNSTYCSVPLLSSLDHGHYIVVGVGCLCFEHHVAMGIGFLVDTDDTGSHR